MIYLAQISQHLTYGLFCSTTISISESSHKTVSPIYCMGHNFVGDIIPLVKEFY